MLPDLNTILVAFSNPCIGPTRPGQAAGGSNSLSLQVNSAGPINPNNIVWNAPVVNVIPRALSGETNQDSEPSLAVNPRAGGRPGTVNWP